MLNDKIFNWLLRSMLGGAILICVLMTVFAFKWMINPEVTVTASAAEATEVREEDKTYSTAVKVDEETFKILGNMEIQLKAREDSLNNLVQEIEDELSKESFYYEIVEGDAKATLSKKVCSDANRKNSETKESYEAYEKFVSDVNKSLKAYDSSYEEYLDFKKEIKSVEQKLSLNRQKQFAVQKEYEKNVLTPDEIESVVKDGLRTQEVQELVDEAQEYADELYDEYYDVMIHIVNAECGSSYCSDTDQYCVANVIENRIKDSNYPNTVMGVVFQKGQYSPTWNGAYNKTPTERVKSNMEEYLRGRIQTGMPASVIYQAMFKQGSGVWKHVTNSIDGGHYYCYR